MTAWLRLVGTLIGAHGWQRPFRTALTVAGIALGVLSSVAILTANREVLRAFERAVLTVAGPATLEVSGRDLGLDETVLEVIRHSPCAEPAAGPQQRAEAPLATPRPLLRAFDWGR